MAYADYNDTMLLTEDMISGIVKKLCGSYKINFHPDGIDSEKVVEIDFTPPFRKIRMIPGLEEKLGLKLPTDFQSEATRVFLDNLCKQH